MRAWELFEGKQLDRHRATTRRPILTLRHIHDLKILKDTQGAKHAQRLVLWRLMYGQDDVGEGDLDEREAELDRREGEVRMKELQLDIEKAINDAEIDQKARQRLQQMAMAQLHRQKKQDVQS